MAFGRKKRDEETPEPAAEAVPAEEDGTEAQAESPASVPPPGGEAATPGGEVATPGGEAPVPGGEAAAPDELPEKESRRRRRRRERKEQKRREKEERARDPARGEGAEQPTAQEDRGDGEVPKAPAVSNRARRKLEAKEERRRARDERRRARGEKTTVTAAELLARVTPKAGAEAPGAAGPTERSSDEKAIREAAERGALARLEESERRDREETVDAGEQRIREEAERRVREVELLQRKAEERVEHARVEAEERVREVAEEASKAAEERVREVAEEHGSERSRLLDELRAAEKQLKRRRAQEQALATELQQLEQRLTEGQQRTEEAIDVAARRLEEVEARATEAEARAARAERLSTVRAEELDREQRLRELLGKIAAAEERASEAEERARATVAEIGEVNEPPELPLEEPTAGDEPAAEEESPPEAEPAGDHEPSGERRAAPWILDTPSAEPKDAEEVPVVPPTADVININQATYEDLRNLNISVTQTGRVLAYRERVGGFRSLDDLDEIPGFPRSFLTDLKAKFTL